MKKYLKVCEKGLSYTKNLSSPNTKRGTQVYRMMVQDSIIQFLYTRKKLVFILWQFFKNTNKILLDFSSNSSENIIFGI